MNPSRKFFSSLIMMGSIFICLNASGVAKKSVLPEGFTYLHRVDPSILHGMRFATEKNCVGAPLEGYVGNQVICTIALARELKKVQVALKKMNKHYSLRIEDAYRPVRATEHLIRWANDATDTKTKAEYYPDLEKRDLPGKYIAAGRSSHNRGSTVDVVIVDLRTGESLDYGPTFFGDYADVDYPGLTAQQRENRQMLRKLMLAHNFKPYVHEFWHFTLKNEPFPKTDFDFVIRNETRK